MEKRFKILRFIGTVYKVVGIIIMVLTLLSSLAICLTPIIGGAFMARVQDELGTPVASTVAGGIIIAVSTLVSGAVLAFTLYATGQGIYLLLAIEENTRATAYFLQEYSE